MNLIQYIRQGRNDGIAVQLGIGLCKSNDPACVRSKKHVDGATAVDGVCSSAVVFFPTSMYRTLPAGMRCMACYCYIWICDVLCYAPNCYVLVVVPFPARADFIIITASVLGISVVIVQLLGCHSKWDVAIIPLR